MTESDESAFFRAFIAMSYLVDSSGVGGLGVPGAAQALQHALCSDDRQVRAAVLARELGHVAASLEARRLA